MIKKVILILAVFIMSTMLFMNCDVLRLLSKQEYLEREKERDDESNDLMDKTYSISINPTDNDDILYDIAIDDRYIYLAGCDSQINSNQKLMRLEKRYKNNGKLVKSFGNNGIIQHNNLSNFKSFNNKKSFTKIQVDNDFIYLGCKSSNIIFNDEVQSSNENWYIQKRDKRTGSLVNSFGKYGQIIQNNFFIKGSLTALLIDENYIYTSNAVKNININFMPRYCSMLWYLEKRHKSDGSLVKEFNGSGIYKFNYSMFNDIIFDIAIKDNFIYASGLDSNYNSQQIVSHNSFQDMPNFVNYLEANESYFVFRNQWRIEKINKTTGKLDPAFGTNGVITEKCGNYSERCEKIVLDNNYLYLVGTFTQDGQFPNFIRIEKRDIVTGNLTDSFGYNGRLDKLLNSRQLNIGSINLFNENLYIAQNSILSMADARNNIEKRNIHNGTLNTEFGNNGIIINDKSSKNNNCIKILLDGDYIFLACNDSANGDTQWRLEKRYASTGCF